MLMHFVPSPKLLQLQDYFNQQLYQDWQQYLNGKISLSDLISSVMLRTLENMPAKIYLPWDVNEGSCSRCWINVDWLADILPGMLLFTQQELSEWKYQS